MNYVIRIAVRLVLICVCIIIFAASGFAAEIRRVPDYDFVEQGLMALTLDVEGAENFRYTGKENNVHVYRGKIKKESKLKLVIKATLGGAKTLPITGRSCTVRMQVVAKKGSEVIKTQNFKSDNKSNVFANYTAPPNADTVEVSETFVLNNKSKNQKYNRTITERNKLILSTSDAGAAVTAGKTKSSDGDEKLTVSKSDKNTTGDKKSSTDNGKADASDGVKDSNGPGKGMLAGVAVAIAAIGGGAFFYMKKRKEGQAVAEEIARKEKLRQQAILRQQELQQQNRQRSQEEINQRNRMLEEERMRVEEEARQQVQREAEQQRLMRERVYQQQMQQQNAMHQQPDVGSQQPVMNGAFVAGAAGVTGSVQNNATENESQYLPDDTPRFCSNCGTPLKPGSRFCENCGEKV